MRTGREPTEKDAPRRVAMGPNNTWVHIVVPSEWVDGARDAISDKMMDSPPRDQLIEFLAETEAEVEELSDPDDYPTEDLEWHWAAIECGFEWER